VPTYDYRCGSCQYEFEQFQSITASPLKTCPNCKRRTLQRLIGSGGGIIFKGSGFYQTDYRSDSYKRAAEADKKTPTEVKEKSATPTGDKPISSTSDKAAPAPGEKPTKKKPRASRPIKP
jgi:putative FmdB family regulatory protein